VISYRLGRYHDVVTMVPHIVYGKRDRSGSALSPHRICSHRDRLGRHRARRGKLSPHISSARRV